MILIAFSEIEFGMLVNAAILQEQHGGQIDVLEFANLGKIQPGENLYILGHGEPGHYANSDPMFGNDLANLLIKNGIAKSGPKHVKITLVTCYSAEDYKRDPESKVRERRDPRDSVAKSLFATLSKELLQSKVTVSVTGFTGAVVVNDKGLIFGKSQPTNEAYNAAVKKVTDNKSKEEWEKAATTVQNFLRNGDPKTRGDEVRRTQYLKMVSKALKDVTQDFYSELHKANVDLMRKEGGGVTFKLE